MKIKRIICGIMAAAMTVPLAAGLAGCGKSASNEFTWFINSGVPSTYYIDYAENPVVQYLESKQFESGLNEGTTNNVKFEFQIPFNNAASDVLQNMFANDDYPEIVDVSQGAFSILDAYDSGWLTDLTPYMEECMPNYLALVKKFNAEGVATTYVNGQQRYLRLLNFEDIDITSMFSGYMYRRDWILKYGKNPSTNEAFTGHYTLDVNGNTIDTTEYSSTVNGDSWEDNVKFPSWYQKDNEMAWYVTWCEQNGKTWDGSDPITISDWEWMFNIFKTAVTTEKLADGYVHSIYYPGYIDNGDFVTGFGGGGVMNYYDKDGKVQFGAIGNNFRVYIQCMNQWWKNGWIDSDFTTRSQDMFYEVDSATVRRGEVGCWFGTLSQLGTRMYNSDIKATHGIIVSSAAQPINDKYGTADNKYKIPDTFYGHDPIGGNLWITSKMKGKDIKLLLRALDWLYSEEGSVAKSIGLNAEQLAEVSGAKKIYDRYGIGDGAYTTVTDNGKTYYMRKAPLENSVDLSNAMSGDRICGYLHKAVLKYSYTDTYTSMLEQFVKYDKTGYFNPSLLPFQISVEEQKQYSKSYSNLKQYMPVEVPKFIKGSSDIYNDDAWNSFVNGVKKRDALKPVEFFNRHFEEYYANQNK